MIAVVALVLVVGIAIARWIDRDAVGERLAGEVILFGLAAPGVLLLVFSLSGVAWTRTRLLAACLTAVIACALAVRRRNSRSVDVDEPLPAPYWSRWSIGIDLVTVLVVGGYCRFAWASAGAENDFIGIWGVKAWTFLEKGGVDWGFLLAAGNWPAHPDYPLLLPAIFSWISLLVSGWNEQLLGLAHPALGLGVLLVVRHALRREAGSPVTVSLVTLALAPAALSPWIGLGEGPMIAFGTAGLLLSRDALDGRDEAATPAAVFLGLAASTKNEGLSLLLAAVVSILIFARRRRWRALLKLWPAAAIAVPWVILRKIADLQTDLTAGDFSVRLAERLTNPNELLHLARLLLTTAIALPWFWIAAIAALVIAWRTARTGERFVVATVLLQAAFFLSAYLMTPNSLEWQVVWSWERLVSQLALSVGSVAALLLLRAISAEPTTALDGHAAG